MKRMWAALRTRSGGRILVAISVVFAMDHAAWGQGSITMKKYIGTDIRGIVTTSDGGIVTAGYTADGVRWYNLSWAYLNVIKLDIQGNVKWTTTLGDCLPRSMGGKALALSIANTADGGFAVGGESGQFNYLNYCGSGFGSTFGAGLVIKLNSAGSVAWTKLIGDPGTSIYATTVTNDGSIVVAGATKSNSGDFLNMNHVASGVGNPDAFVVRMDASGTITSKMLFGSNGDEEGNAIAPVPDGSVVVAGSSLCNTRCSQRDGDLNGVTGGYTNSLYAYLQDIIVFKVAADGSVEWKKIFGGNGADVARGIVRTADGGFLVCGSTTSNDGDFAGLSKQAQDIFVIKLDASGTLLWRKVYGGTNHDDANAICELSNGEIVVTGSTKSNDGDFQGLTKGGGIDIVYLKLDASGNILTKRVIGGTSDEQCYAVVSAPYGGTLLGGFAVSNSNDFADKGNGNAAGTLLGIDANTCPLAITSQPQGSSVKDGQSASMTVGVSTSPNTTYQWQRNDGSAWINIASDPRFFGITSSKLTIESATNSTKGPFRCVVTSGSCSVTSNEASLTVSCNCGTK
ncbi:MAG: immunoglobulin domain-containing protein [Candidatus Kapabacteria bacterium]|nr:immunoglobulin domain-containing protein [Candidatus Kapabacteria bacterium]